MGTEVLWKMKNLKFSFLTTGILYFMSTSFFVLAMTSNNVRPDIEQDKKIITPSLSEGNNDNHDNLDENQGCNLGNQLDETLEQKVMREFDQMESIFREKFEKEEEKFYRLRASGAPNDNRLDRLKEDLQRDIDQLKAQLESKVEDDLLVLEEEQGEADTIFGDNHDNIRVKRHNSKKKSTFSTPCYSNLCSFPFRTQYGGLKDNKLNNQPPTSCDDLGKMGYTMSAFYPVKDKSNSDKISIVHCEFNSPLGKDNEYGHITIGNKMHVDLAACMEAEKPQQPKQQEKRPSYQPKNHDNQESQDQHDIQYQPEQEEQETAPQNEGFLSKVLKAGGNILSSLFQG